jgi:hypothetical protein
MTNTKGGYTAVELSAESRQCLIEMVPPKHSREIYHHVTLSMGKPKRLEPLLDKENPISTTLFVLGYITTFTCQVAIVELPEPLVKLANQPKKEYHVTCTLADLPHVKPMDSNQILQRYKRDGGYTSGAPEITLFSLPLLLQGTIVFFG